MSLQTPIASVVFDYQSSGKKIACLESLVGKGGWLNCHRISVSAIESEDHLIFVGFTDNILPLDDTQCHRLFDLNGITSNPVEIDVKTKSSLNSDYLSRKIELLSNMTTRNGRWFETEIDKLDKWADDRRVSLKAELSELDEAIKEAKKAARSAPNLPEKLEIQKKIRNLDKKRNEAWKNYDNASREIDQKKEVLIDEVESKLKQKIKEETLFTIKWELK